MTAEQRDHMLDLRKQGMTHREIGKAVNRSVSTVHKAIDEAIAAIPFENAEQVRHIELERVDKMLEGIWDSATTGDPKAVVAVVKLMERRAKYLGLDAPEKREHSGEIKGAISLDDLTSAIATAIHNDLPDAATIQDEPRDADGSESGLKH